MTRNHIICEIQRVAYENDGHPPGRRSFYLKTGIKETDWSGKYWAKRGDAIAEAGFAPNRLQQLVFTEEQLLEKLAVATSELDRFPTIAELKLYARRHRGFPSHSVFARVAKTRAARAAKLLQFCDGRAELQRVSLICAAVISAVQPDEESDDVEPQRLGYVYLLRSGRFYKIGFTNSAGRRERELAVQLPQRIKLLHSIETDDPTGIEQYWHRRFANKRRNGEWFELSGEDVKVFRRRRFM